MRDIPTLFDHSTRLHQAGQLESEGGLLSDKGFQENTFAPGFHSVGFQRNLSQYGRPVPEKRTEPSNAFTVFHELGAVKKGFSS
jgi:hypothetical protein